MLLNKNMHFMKEVLKALQCLIFKFCELKVRENVRFLRIKRLEAYFDLFLAK